jgi:hypothetical protein
MPFNRGFGVGHDKPRVKRKIQDKVVFPEMTAHTQAGCEGSSEKMKFVFFYRGN